MKYLVVIIFAFLFLSACDKPFDDKFYKTYREILIVRTEITDSLEANKEVLKALKKNGYTEEEFREIFFEKAQTEREFIKIIDSLRNSIKSEYKQILDSNNQKK
jgi:hypothetical protein